MDNKNWKGPPYHAIEYGCEISATESEEGMSVSRKFKKRCFVAAVIDYVKEIVQWIKVPFFIRQVLDIFCLFIF